MLRQLEAQTRLPRQVLIVDNGGTLDETDRRRMPLADRTMLISRPENPGYGAAANEARPHLGSDALLVLTHDAEFGPGLAESLLAAHEANRDSGSAAPLLHFSSDRNRVFSAGGRLTRGGRAVPWLRPLSQAPYPVDWVDGAIVMHSARALDTIDWLDEGYFLYFEDVDTGWRLARAGFASLIVPTEIAYQQPGTHPMYLGVRNMALFARKAGIPLYRQLPSFGYRIARESIARVRRGMPVRIKDVWQGWRDGRAGISGLPDRRH